MVTVEVNDSQGWQPPRTKTLAGNDREAIISEWIKKEFPWLIHRAVVGIPDEPEEEEE